MATWIPKRARRFMVLTLMLAVLVLSGALAVYADSTAFVPDPDAPALLGQPTPPPQGGLANVIFNGSFEKGFVNGLAEGWGQFQNGDVFANWYDDTWEKVVFDGEHAQLMELKNAQKLDRYVGIFQAVHVVPDSDYILTLHGLVRSVPGSPELTDFGFRMQYGIDYRGDQDWQSPDIKWVELPWDEQPRTEPTRIDVFSTTIRTQGPQLTLFIRGWKKWADAVEGDYDVDGVSLVGPIPPAGMQPPPGMQPTPGMQPSPTSQPEMPVTGKGLAIFGNPVVAVPSITLLAVLIGGAAWGVVRRRQ